MYCTTVQYIGMFSPIPTVVRYVQKEFVLRASRKELQIK